MKNVLMAVVVCVAMGLAYLAGLGAGLGRATVSMDELSAKVETLEKAVGQAGANHNGLVQGLKKEFETFGVRNSNQLMSLSLIEKVVKHDLGNRKYNSYLKDAREELNAQLKDMNEARLKAARAHAKTAALLPVQPPVKQE